MKSLRKNLEEGFTLVELMVVVAIIGILSAVAIPNFKKYQAKSKTSEAKLHLSSIYSAESSFMADADSFASCLQTMGYDPSGETANRYYATGFNADHNNGTINGIACPAGQFFFVAGKVVGGNSADVVGYLSTTTINAAGDEFTAGAGGPIAADRSSAASADKWLIDQNKNLTHPVLGY